MTPVLRLAVVGHTNTGKTSLVRTLTRDDTFGEVSDRGGVTREVEGAVLLVEGRAAIELHDTPGLEDSVGLLGEVESLRASRSTDGHGVLVDLLAAPAARPRFAQEFKALAQVLACDAALYVIDARDRPVAKHRDELAILALCARPVVPVLNFVATPGARTAEWRDLLARAGMHAVAEFDTVVLSVDSERRLLEKIRSLADRFSPTLDALIEERRRLRARLIAASARVVAELLVDVASMVQTVRTGDAAALDAATAALRDRVRDRERRCARDLVRVHRFTALECQLADLRVTGEATGPDLFSAEARRMHGVRAGAGAAGGALAGLMVDAALHGLSLGAATAVGAAIGALGAAGPAPGRAMLRRLRGVRELRADRATLTLLAARQLELTEALLARGHASQRPFRLDDPAAPASRRVLRAVREASRAAAYAPGSESARPRREMIVAAAADALAAAIPGP